VNTPAMPKVGDLIGGRRVVETMPERGWYWTAPLDADPAMRKGWSKHRVPASEAGG